MRWASEKTSVTLALAHYYLCPWQAQATVATYLQHTQAVHAWDTLAVPQQIAAIQPRGKQELLSSLPANFSMIHSHCIHGLVDSWVGLYKGLCCCCCSQARSSHLTPSSARCAKKRQAPEQQDVVYLPKNLLFTLQLKPAQQLSS